MKFSTFDSTKTDSRPILDGIISNIELLHNKTDNYNLDVIIL